MTNCHGSRELGVVDRHKKHLYLVEFKLQKMKMFSFRTIRPGTAQSS